MLLYTKHMLIMFMFVSGFSAPMILGGWIVFVLSLCLLLQLCRAVDRMYNNNEAGAT